jgi:CHAT domain-containing protein
VLVEYLLGEKRSLVWVVTARSVETIALPPRKDIEEQVDAYRKVLRDPVSALTVTRSLVEINRAGAKLFRSVFEPIQTAVGSARRLIIVPDGALEYLPFEALVVGSTRAASGETRPSYLADRTAIVYGPSASALVAVQAMNGEPAAPGKMLAAFGDPLTNVSGPARQLATAPAHEPASPARAESPADAYAARGFSLTRLPYTRTEVLAISNLFPESQRQIYLGAAAREETVKAARLGDYRFIHFATHGFLDETKPGRSGILLSRVSPSKEDGILQIGEIMRLKLNADLVTLSACSTGLGKLVSGEGILGLTRSIFYAGARNVAVSLWNVNDSATATLMADFYRNLKQGLTKDEALRQAKLALLHGPQRLWQHPYYWAAFIIEGEGR